MAHYILSIITVTLMECGHFLFTKITFHEVYNILHLLPKFVLNSTSLLEESERFCYLWPLLLDDAEDVNKMAPHSITHYIQWISKGALKKTQNSIILHFSIGSRRSSLYDLTQRMQGSGISGHHQISKAPVCGGVPHPAGQTLSLPDSRH